MANNQSAKKELEEFKSERASADDSLEAQKAFVDKWFGRYPAYRRKRSLFRGCELVLRHLEYSAEKENES